MTAVRVLVVDDSATMRALIRSALARDPGLVVVGEAGDAQTARAAVKALDPDVVTLDIEMPGMDGLDFLQRLMRLRPTPVVMVFSMAPGSAAATVQALELGAVDCVAKPTPDRPGAFDILPEIVRAAAAARRGQQFRPGAAPMPDARPQLGARAGAVRLVALAASTGGVEALAHVISGLPADSPPIAVVQHMPPLFTASFAQRLNRLSAVSVREAEDGLTLERGTAVIAPGGERHLEVHEADDGRLRCCLTGAGPQHRHCPSADRLFQSAARCARARAVGVILTGMGADGAAGLLAMRQAGAHTIGQDEATSIVFGMPQAAHRIGAVAEQLPLNRIADGIVRAIFKLDTRRTTTNVIPPAP